MVAAALAVFINGFSSIMTALNFVVTIHRLRAPGMTWMRLPLFVWGIYAISVVMLLATPVLAMTVFLMAIERFMRRRHLRSGARRRSAAVSAHVLVLLASRRLHHDPAGDGRGQRADHLLRAEADLRL